MFKKMTLLSTIAFLLLTIAACDNKKETKTSTPSKASEAISVIDAKIRELPPGQKVTAMYMKLKNASGTNHDLVKVEGDISQMIELHTHTMEDGVMKMGEVESIPVAANSTTEAKSGSYHVMIMGLSKDPKLGDKYEFNFIFKDGSTIPVTAEVKKIHAHSH